MGYKLEISIVLMHSVQVIDQMFLVKFLQLATGSNLERAHELIESNGNYYFQQLISVLFWALFLKQHNTTCGRLHYMPTYLSGQWIMVLIMLFNGTNLFFFLWTWGVNGVSAYKQLL